MEENKEDVVEETAQDQTVETVDESKFESAGDDSVIKVDLSKVPTEEKATEEVVAEETPVEEVIEAHYNNQIKKIGDDEQDLKSKIEKFRSDEVDHKNIAYELGASNKGLYGVIDKLIKTGSRIAITISEKI